MLVIRDGASSVGMSRFLEQPEATVASAARATRGRFKRDMALSCGRTFNRRYRCWLHLGKRENLDPSVDTFVDSSQQAAPESIRVMEESAAKAYVRLSNGVFSSCSTGWP